MNSEMEGGRFDFDDGGSYVGEWCEGRAHGLGIATGPENQGEYSGEWNMGFESRGVYIWPSGNIYSGTWLKGKRHGEGVQVKGRWLYRGSFTTGFCGRYGVKESLASCAKYEGSWHLNQFDGFGVETNSDGSTYAGAWSKGMRQGLGVRRSAPYSFASEFYRTVRASQSQNSLPSGTDSDRGWRGTGSSGGSGGDMRNLQGAEKSRLDERRSGFVLRSVSCPPGTTPAHLRQETEKKSIFKRGIFKKLRKQKSTGDLSMIAGSTAGGFSTSGGGTTGSGLFQNKLRRPGGSLRSNLSASSQFTTNSFGRTDGKAGLGNGGAQALRETIEEVPGPNVVETYSGQWNEDRRSGYGVAERSDGLRYAGEWFNNKKDGLGVTFHANGMKEEGRYKENIIVQVFNRKSKLFMFRHGKLKDAIEEAVRNANDAARKAQENAVESAFQRANTARMVASTAEIRAVEARKLSEDARTIAKEFSPEFVQVGLIWEKQNPLLKKELFGAAHLPDEDLNDKHQDGGAYLQNNLVTENVLDLEASRQIGNRLEVSGGSRHGSFRSSFRRNRQSEDQQQPNPNKISNNSDFYSQQQDLNVNSKTGSNYTLDMKRGYDTNLHQNPPSQLDIRSRPNQRTPSGRPMARAATTGFTDLGTTEPHQLAHHLAQHPHSPYLMASQYLDPAQSNYATAYPNSSMEVMNSTQPDQFLQVPTQANDNKPVQVRLENAQLVQPTPTHQASLGCVEQQGADLSSFNMDPNLMTNNDFGETLDHWDQESLISKNPSLLSEALTITSESRVRRRTMPSIMTEPPLLSANLKSNAEKLPNLKANARMNQTSRAIQQDLDDQTVHSVENLRSRNAETYIIENGIRKRVQAETEHYHQYHHCQNQQNQLRNRNAANFENSTAAGSRPKWTTAYDPYRPAMESTGVITPPQSDYQKSYVDPDSIDLMPLPKSYYIESVINLAGSPKESSMPDIAVACNSFKMAEHEKRRAALFSQTSKPLTREEVSRLSQARRQELHYEMGRRRRGEIVIRLADIKDWIQANFVIVFVLLINASLAFLFFNLLNDNTPSTPSTSSTAVPSSRAMPSPVINPNSIASKTINTAKKTISMAMKARKQNPNKS